MTIPHATDTDSECTQIVIGVDPGPWTGIVMLKYTATGVLATYPAVLEVSYHIVPEVIHGLYLPPPVKIVIGYEPFVIGALSAKSGHAVAGRITRDVCGQLEALADLSGRIHVVSHTAALISGWASTERLRTLGLDVMTKNYRHANSAAKHAMYTATKAAGIPDPLSKRSRAKVKT